MLFVQLWILCAVLLQDQSTRPETDDLPPARGDNQQVDHGAGRAGEVLPGPGHPGECLGPHRHGERREGTSA